MRGFEFPPPRTRFAKAAADLLAGAAKSWLWTALAVQDIKLKYRGSLLGPLWITISTAAMIAMMGVLYAKLFHSDVGTYLPFVAIGLVTWQFISMVVIEGCSTFLAVQNIIQQVPLPFSIHAYRSVCRNLLVLAHNFAIVPVVLVIFHVPVDWRALLAVPALLVLAINGVWASLLFGIVSARFRDVPPIVASIVQMVFFITPIFWSPELLGQWQGIAELNPFFAAIDIVRAPLLGVAPAPNSWLVMLVVTTVCSGGTFAFFARFHARIAFWV
jgi:ABC-2 type transport system permease protein/lipopolysaccharide transport system permease protein